MNDSGCDVDNGCGQRIQDQQPCDRLNVRGDLWHPPLVVPSYLDDDVCSECGRPFVDIRACEKCDVPGDIWTVKTHAYFPAVGSSYVDVVDGGGQTVLPRILLLREDKERFERMVECRNLIDGPEEFADTYDMGNGITGLGIDKMLGEVVDVAIDKAARKIVRYLVWESLRTEELVEQVAGVLRDELRMS